MRMAILLFDNVTALDVVGPFEVLRLTGADEVVFVGKKAGEVRARGALGLAVDRTLDEVPAADIVLVPGGPGQVPLMADEEVLAWLRRIDETTTWTTAVCTGSLLLAAAGLLSGRRATTHWLALDQFPAFGVEPSEERVVFDGKYVTAAGVSAGIDMAFRLGARLSGDDVAQTIQLAIEYDPQPPFDVGSPAKAPAELVASMRENIGRFLRAET
jgi:transcriptional regulator GlxA family with amidase domain